MNVFETDKTYIANTYKRFPVEIVEGKGALLKGSDGKTYIDLGSGIAVNTFGVNDEQWVAAVTAQLGLVSHTSNLYYTAPQAKLAEMLCKRTGMKKVFFGNSGAEANECAIKVTRKYASDKYGEGARPTIITLINSFHGRTIATLSATGQDVFHHSFGPFVEGFVYVPANDIDAMKAAIENNAVCGVMMEMVQGEGGVLPLEKDFVQETAKICAEKDILFVVDEVQTGNGRTGTLYAYEQFGVTPDVVSTAKGIGGGLPIGCCMIGEKAQDTLGASSHGSTFGGNPICAAGAVSILSRLDETVLAGVRERHDLIVSMLEGAEGVKGITGLGLMLGIQTEKPAGEVAAACLEKGVLVLTAKTKVRLLPALNIPMDQLKQAIEVLKAACC
ncbi:MAG: acetylornithine/succinylornithine family transaminase [Clostridia bacterium]|nr:acetylornithine/succinylornithine family transaminase [Clostridia bacterium]